MKFTRVLRGASLAGLSAAVALGSLACSRDYTAAYVYSISSQGGNISAFQVDYQTGILSIITGSPFPSQLTNPTTLVAAPNGRFLYAIGGSQNATVEEIAVGTDGKLYAQNGYNLVGGSYPSAATVDPSGSFLYVTYTYSTGYTPASPGPGGVDVFPINADNTLGPAVSTQVGNNPTAVTATPTINGQAYVYVSDAETSPYATVLGYARAASGALTPLPTTVFSTALNTVQGVRAGVSPSAMVVDPTGRYLYATDKIANQVLGYNISQTGTTAGQLTAMLSSPFGTGQFPVGMTIDPRGLYLYTANQNSSTVTGFTINQADGALSVSAGTGNFSTGTQPLCVSIEPALGIYLFTADHLSGTVSAAKLDYHTGSLTAVAATPYPAGALPSCLVAVPNGEHATAIVNP